MAQTIFYPSLEKISSRTDSQQSELNKKWWALVTLFAFNNKVDTIK